MHDVYFAMGEHSLRAGRSILLDPVVLIAFAVAHLTRELLVGLNEDGHRGLQLGVGVSEGCIVPHQSFHRIILFGSSRSEGVKIFIEVSSRHGWTICFIGFRRLPKCVVSGAKLVLASNDLLIDLGLPV